MYRFSSAFYVHLLGAFYRDSTDGQARARQLQARPDAGEMKNLAELTRRLGLIRARITRVREQWISLSLRTNTAQTDGYTSGESHSEPALQTRWVPKVVFHCRISL